MYLVKPCDKSQSEPVDFYFYPNLDKNLLSSPSSESKELHRSSDHRATEEPNPNIKNNLGSQRAQPEQGLNFTQRILNMSFDELQRAYY